MVAALAALLLIAPSHRAERTVTLNPSDDVWVYPHASDPANDPFLRVWGSDGQSVAKDGEHGEFSYGFLRFDLSSIPKGRLKSAHLILTHAPAATWTLENVTANPVEARLLKGDFDEKTWAYEKIDKCAPDPTKEGLLGQSVLDKMPAEGKSAKFDIDLVKGSNFGEILDKAFSAAPPHLSLAIASKVDPAALGRTSVYKFYSKDNADKAVQPALILTFED